MVDVKIMIVVCPPATPSTMSYFPGCQERTCPLCSNPIALSPMEIDIEVHYGQAAEVLFVCAPCLVQRAPNIHLSDQVLPEMQAAAAELGLTNMAQHVADIAKMPVRELLIEDWD